MDGTESTDSAAGEESGGTRGVNRRRVLRAGAFTAAAFFIAHSTGDFGPLRAAAESGALGRGEERDGAPRHSGPYTDDPIDPAAVADGSARWSPTRYGPADEIGALNEITPHKTLEALQLIKNNRNKPPRTYSMGELLEPNVPAFGTRVYEQTLVGPVPPPYLGANQVNFLEERINTTYQIGTQLDGLCHFGVGDVWYNGLRTEQMVAGNPHGASRCGQELVRPFVTRGILLDVLSVKVRQGASDALGPPVDGKPILANSYRITLEDLEAAMELGKTGPVEAGDVVVIRTGWTHLFSATDPVKKARYLATEPGIYLREARWLADRRPAIVASDTWALEVLPAPAPWSGTQLFPVHQELITHHGIRVGEAFRSEELAADRVYKFVFFYTGVRAKGATCGNVSPGALA